MKPSERRKARHCATQAIYQWQMTQANVGDIEEQFKIDQDTKGVDLNYFRDLLFGVAVHCNELDKVFAPFLSRPLEEVDMVDKAILRLATYELTRREDVPPRVVIKEYVDVAAAFFGPTESGMVNAVLDKIAREERAEEMG